MNLLKKHSALIILVAFSTLFSACAGNKETTSSKEPESIKLSEGQRRSFSKLFIDANRAKILGNYGEALNTFKQALSIDPSSSATMYEIARIYAEDGNFPAALTYAKNAVEYDNNNVWYKEFLAQLYAETGRMDESIEVYKSIIAEQPNNFNYYYNLGSLYSSQGRYDEALKLYNDLEERLGLNQDLAMQRQLIYIEKGDYDAALEEIQKLIDANPEDVRLYGMKAEIYEQLGKEEKAVDIYESMLLIEPENGLVLLALYEISKKNGKEEQAREYLDRAFSSPGLGIDVKVNILLNYLSRNDFESRKGEVKRLAEKLEKAHSTDAKAYAIHGDVLYNLGELESAREKFRQAVKIDPNRPPIWQQIVTIDSQLNDFESMRTDSQEAIELFPQLPIFYLFNGIALIQEDRFEEAVDILNSGKNLVVDDNQILAQFYSSLGDAYHSLEAHAESDSAYEMALKLEPANVVVLNNYAYYLSIRGAKLDKAEAMAKKANDLSPNVASFQDTYGWVLYKKENYKNALFWIEEALKNGGGEDPVVHEHRGDVFIKLNNPEEAVKSWKKALDFGGDPNVLNIKIEEHTPLEE